MKSETKAKFLKVLLLPLGAIVLFFIRRNSKDAEEKRANQAD